MARRIADEMDMSHSIIHTNKTIEGKAVLDDIIYLK